MSLRQHPLGVDEEVRVSLGGLQSKLLLVETADGWARSAAGTPSTHILKPDPPEHPGLVAVAIENTDAHLRNHAFLHGTGTVSLIREMVCWGLTEDSAGEVADATLTALAGSYAEAARAVPEVSPGIVEDCETRTAILLRHR
jgi:hypothetical protein